MDRPRPTLPRPILALASTLIIAGCGDITQKILPPAIYVTTGSPSQILAFSSSAPGTPSPLNTVALPAGVVAGYIAGDPSGNLYVTTSSDVRVYPAGATGPATPARVLPAGPTTTIANITGFTADASGSIYVSEFNAGIAIFTGHANGSVAPSRYILPGLSGLEFPEALATDSAGNLYVVNVHSNWQSTILVFAPGATGDVAPLRTLNVSANGIAVDSAGNLYATVNAAGNTAIEVFAPGAAGNDAPIRTISTQATGLARLTGGIALDAAGDIYVVAWGTLAMNSLPATPTILEFSASANTAASASFTPAAWTPAIPVLVVH